MRVASASILICTYNRARLLRETLGALQAMTPPPGCETEIIVVDNNSTDNTALVIEEAIRHSRTPIIGLSESRQGKSFALNRGLEAARGDILALTDDDVWPDPEWMNRIVADFRAGERTFVFGKVLPRWGCTPPPEMLIPKAQDIWGPLAIVDYGDEAVEYVATSTGQRLPIGANLAFARHAIATIGGWRTDLGKVNNTLISGEDHEIFMRLRRFGLYAGYYDPLVTVRHFVPAARLTRTYFRQWFFWLGKTHALMLNDLYPELDMPEVTRIGGVPRFLLRQSLEQIVCWMRSLAGRDALTTFIEELRALQYIGLLVQCWRQRAAQSPSRLDTASPLGACSGAAAPHR